MKRVIFELCLRVEMDEEGAAPNLHELKERIEAAVDGSRLDPGGLSGVVWDSRIDVARVDARPSEEVMKKQPILYSSREEEEEDAPCTRFSFHKFSGEKGTPFDEDKTLHRFRIAYVRSDGKVFISCRGQDFPKRLRDNVGGAMDWAPLNREGKPVLIEPTAFFDEESAARGFQDMIEWLLEEWDAE